MLKNNRKQEDLLTSLALTPLIGGRSPLLHDLDARLEPPTPDYWEGGEHA